MSDQCKHCTIRGDYNKCITTECFHHESWIDLQRIKKIKELEQKVVNLGDDINSLEYDKIHLNTEIGDLMNKIQGLEV